MDHEDWLRRKIELKQQALRILQEEIGDLVRELSVYLGKEVNQQQNYGGNIEPKPIFDPFLDK